jgi:hypothetical protein
MDATSALDSGVPICRIAYLIAWRSLRPSGGLVGRRRLYGRVVWPRCRLTLRWNRLRCWG